MKIGVSYNLFDGEELLEGSLNSIKKFADHICVVYQEISNYGKYNPNLESLLKELKGQGMINDIIEYKPNFSLSPQENEIIKRNLGLSNSIKNGCNYHMSIDADEFYNPTELDMVKKILTENSYDILFCNMLTYYKNENYVLDPPESYYVPFLHKINENTEFIFAYPSPVEVDPTRRTKFQNFKIFDRNQIVMHHMSMVRNDIRSKLENSSAKILFKDEIDKIVNYFNNWSYPNPVLWPGKPSKYLKVKKIEKKSDEKK